MAEEPLVMDSTIDASLSSASKLTAPDSSVVPPPSKKALKKQAKAERLAAQKLERRKKEKESRKEKRRVLAQKRAAGELDESEEEKRAKKRAKIAKPTFHGRVVVDLGFDDKMTEKEIKSLCSQLAYTYSANRNSGYPFELIYSSTNGSTKEKLENQNDGAYKRWNKTKWWEEGYEKLWTSAASTSNNKDSHDHGPLNTLDPEAMPQNGSQVGEEQLPLPIEETSTADFGSLLTEIPAQNVQQTVVYLTADADEELTELREDETYIIGGLVDHNRYKNICLNKAHETGVRAARLPIGRYLATLQTRKVLTVNQAFEILLKWVETKDWEQALLSVIPKRKFQGGTSDATKTQGVTEDAGDIPDDVQEVSPEEEEV